MWFASRLLCFGFFIEIFGLLVKRNLPIPTLNLEGQQPGPAL